MIFKELYLNRDLNHKSDDWHRTVLFSTI